MGFNVTGENYHLPLIGNSVQSMGRYAFVKWAEIENGQWRAHVTPSGAVRERLERYMGTPRKPGEELSAPIRLLDTNEQIMYVAYPKGYTTFDPARCYLSMLGVHIGEPCSMCGGEWDGTMWVMPERLATTMERVAEKERGRV